MKLFELPHDQFGMTLTLYSPKMMLFQEGWVRERPSRNHALCQLVAYVGCAKAISHAHELRLAASVAARNSSDPFRDGLIGKGGMFLLPRFIVKGLVGIIVAVLPVFPNGVLGSQVKQL